VKPCFFAVARAVDGNVVEGALDALLSRGHPLSFISYRGTDHVLAIIDYQLFHKLAQGQCLPELAQWATLLAIRSVISDRGTENCSFNFILI
jgi:hypothetical protein